MSEEKSMTIYILGRYDCPRLTHFSKSRIYNMF